MDTDRPVVILRNPRTGQVRGILRGSDGSGLDMGDMADPRQPRGCCHEPSVPDTR